MTLTVNPSEHILELKYRPGTIGECILPKADRDVFLGLAKKAKLPHLILQSNSPGTGKTTVALALANDINAEVMFVNGSGCGIDFIKNEATAFASSKSLEGRPKVLILDEFDRPQLAEAQRYLRSFMEAYGKTCSVIITANNLEGIIGPLKSRANIIKFGVPTADDRISMLKEMIKRCILICEHENIEVQDPKVLAALVKKNWPDFRKTINQLDHYSVNKVIDSGILDQVIEDRGNIDDVIEALKDRNIKNLRTLSAKYAPDYPFFIEKLIDTLYPLISNQSVIAMYEACGENNQLSGLAANIEVHLMHLFIQILKNIEFN